jgi:hypothetical protein
MQIDDILKAVNLADYDGAKVLEVSIDDLKFLCNEIIDLRANNRRYKDNIKILEAKLYHSVINKPIKLETYNKRGELNR